MPLAVGAPLMVIILDAHAALTPAGKPVADPIPVAPVVVWVMFVNGELIHKDGAEDAAVAVLTALTVTVVFAPVNPVVLTHPLASVIDVKVYEVVELGDGPLNAMPLTTLL